MTVNSSGITAEVVGVAYSATQSLISVQIILKNTSNVRIYLQDAQNDPTQNAFLGSGQNFNSPNVNGLPSCGNTYSVCAGTSWMISIDKFSYIDPGSFLSVALAYNTSQPPANSDTISFSLTMLARFARSNIDDSPNDAGSVQEITLAFPQLSFSIGN